MGDKIIPTLDWLCNPEVFAVNRLKAHSDHKYTVNGRKLKQSLNGQWKFTYSDCPYTREKDFYKTEYDISALEDITVPGHIQRQGYGIPQYVNIMYPWDGVCEVKAPKVPMDVNAVGGYVKDVVIDEKLKGKRIYISFQGVETAFYLYVNDEFVGYSEDSFTPSEFEITDYVVEGKNRIGVEVYQRSSASWLEDQDFWRFSGIFREVYLYATPDLHIGDIFVHTELDENYTDATLSMDAEIMTPYSKVLDEEVLYEEQKEKVCQEVAEMISNVCADFKLVDGNDTVIMEKKNLSLCELFDTSYEIKQPKLWSAEEPNLYEIIISLYDHEGKEIETVFQTVGFRKFEIKDKLMLLNGKRIEFFGVDRHEFNCYTGRCITMEDMLWDIKFLKQHNINAVRNSHYPNDIRWYRLCDKYGIYLIDETNLETHGTWAVSDNREESAIPGDKPEWCNAVLDRTNSMIQRDKNHPSILMWSCGNESFGGVNIKLMSQLMKKLDPARPVHYEGLFNDRRFPETSDIESRMYCKVWDIEEYLNSNPDKPFINCEYAHSMGNSTGNIYDYVKLLDKYEMYQGGFVWDYIDQLLVDTDEYGEEYLAYGGDFGDRPNDGSFCANGIVTAKREATPKAQEVKNVYAQVTLRPDKGGVWVKNRRLFKDTSDLELKVEMLKDGEVCFVTTIDAVVAPGEEKYFEVAIAMPAIAGEFIIQAYMMLKEDTFYADKGHEVSFGIAEPFKVSDSDILLLKDTSEYEGFEVVEGDYNIGVYGDDFGYLFSKWNGGLISLKCGGKEFLKGIPKPTYYRASVDNEKGSNYMYDSGIWQHIEKWQRCNMTSYCKTDRDVVINYEYELPLSEDGTIVVNNKAVKYDDNGTKGNGAKPSKVKVVYTINISGRINVKAVYDGIKGAPELPVFGMQLPLKPEFDHFKFYGMGPHENYIDRNVGAKYGIFESTVEDNLTKYHVPCGCGNRTNTRWLKVDNGYESLTFRMVSEAFQFTVLNYTEAQLEEALHIHELPAPYYTFVKLYAKANGVAGDDSWGALAYDEYRTDATKPIILEFDIISE